MLKFVKLAFPLCSLLVFFQNCTQFKVQSFASIYAANRGHSSQISSIQVSGNPVMVFDHTIDQQQAMNIPDAQVTAWKEADGTVNLTIPSFENYRMRGNDLTDLSMDPNEIFSSTTKASDITENHYNYYHWFMSPYTLDGVNIYTVSHSEWYACLLNGNCGQGSNQINSWVTTLTSFMSTDGGATWALNGANENHVVAALGYYWTGTQALQSQLYVNGLNHTGLMTPTRLIYENGYYYQIGTLIQRNFSDIVSGSATVDRNGYALVRTPDFTNPSRWEEWIGGSQFQPTNQGPPTPFLPIDASGSAINACGAQMIFDNNANVYILIFTVCGTNGGIYYMTTASLGNPSWSTPSMILGTDTFQPNPTAYTGQVCNTGFGAGNYISIIDGHSTGYNFEFTDGDPWLFYVVNPAFCGGDNTARDLYRLQLNIHYFSPQH